MALITQNPTVATKTKTKVLTHTKVAIGIIALGFASLAASAAGFNGELANISDARLPELEVNRIQLSPNTPIVLSETEEETQYLEVSENEERLSIAYRNTGVTTPDQPFVIKVTFNPSLYLDGDVYQLIRLESKDGTESEVVRYKVDPTEFGEYLFTMDSVEGDSEYVPNLNRYALEENREGRLELIIPRYYRQMLNGGLLSISAEVDYGGISGNGTIKERIESNNFFNEIIVFSDIEEKVGEACTAHEDDEGNNSVLEGCHAEGLYYACIDRYTHSFKGCVEEESDCAELPGDVSSCVTGIIPIDRPIIRSVRAEVSAQPYTIDQSQLQNNFVKGTTFAYTTIDRSPPMKVTLRVDNVTENTEYGFYLADLEIDFTKEALAEVAGQIKWNEKPVHEFRTLKKEFAIHVFTRNNDGQGVQIVEVEQDIDDFVSFVLMEE